MLGLSQLSELMECAAKWKTVSIPCPKNLWKGSSRRRLLPKVREKEITLFPSRCRRDTRYFPMNPSEPVTRIVSVKKAFLQVSYESLSLIIVIRAANIQPQT